MNQTLNETAMQVSQVLGQNLPITNSPTMDIFLISLVGALFITLINKYFSDQVKIRALRKEMKDLQKKSREMMSKDPKKAQVLQKELMKKNLENMKHAMNPKIMIITMAPMLLLFFFYKNSLYSIWRVFHTIWFS